MTMKIAAALAAVATLALATAHAPARAADVAPSLMDANTQVCVQLDTHPKTRALDPHAPADDARVPAYCRCVTKAYWAAVPQADYDGMMAEKAAGNANGPHALAIRAALHARNEAARAACH